MISNRGPKSIRFLFKQHLPVALNFDCRLALPAGTIAAVDPSFGNMVDPAGCGEWLSWTNSEGTMIPPDEVPPSTDRLRETIDFKELPERRFGVRNQRTGATLEMQFSREVFPCVWLFLPYGGRRDIYTSVLEPCTNWPKNMNDALEYGQCAALNASEVLDTTISVELS
jgi:hypothetical protein